jgi:hypothetical protein
MKCSVPGSALKLNGEADWTGHELVVLASQFDLQPGKSVVTETAVP